MKDNKSKRKKEQMSPERRRASIILGVLSAIFIVLTVFLVIIFREYLTDIERVRSFINRHIIVGTLIMIALCAVQVVVALVPGELVEIAAGYAFGAWGGMVVCLIGATIGSIIVILLVRRFGRKFVYTFYPKEKMDSIKWLHDTRKRNSLTFILFLIPGTPKDLLTYAIGLTDMGIPTYILLTTAARFPSLITSTMGGSAVGEQNYKSAIIIFAITAAISLVGLIIYNVIEKKHQKAAEQHEKAVENSDEEPKP
ncbi:MAG: TVP38/TMEM64 family protein [Clostridia bacterium]|nr:TVP38/TMEM64 family protein [Clostridia bacterium]